MTAVAYIAGASTNEVYAINLDTRTVQSSVAVGATPYGVAIDATGTYLYCANQGGNSISKIDIATFSVVTTLTTSQSQPTFLAIDSTSTYMYVACNTGYLLKVSLSTFTEVVAGIATASNSQYVALDPSDSFAYVANNGASSVSKVDLSTFSVVGSLTVGQYPQGIVVD